MYFISRVSSSSQKSILEFNNFPSEAAVSFEIV